MPLAFLQAGSDVFTDSSDGRILMKTCLTLLFLRARLPVATALRLEGFDATQADPAVLQPLQKNTGAIAITQQQTVGKRPTTIPVFGRERSQVLTQPAGNALGFRQSQVWLKVGAANAAAKTDHGFAPARIIFENSAPRRTHNHKWTATNIIERFGLRGLLTASRGGSQTRPACCLDISQAQESERLFSSG